MENLQDLQERLSQVNAAITRILTTGQDWTQGQRRQTEAQLAELRRERRELEMKIARKARGGIVARRVSPRV